MCSETIYRFYRAKVKTSICVVASREKLEAENQNACLMFLRLSRRAASPSAL